MGGISGDMSLMDRGINSSCTRIPFHAGIGSVHHAPHGEGPSGIRALRCPIRVLIVGGNWNNGAMAGLSYWNSNNDLSNSNDNIGARSAYPSDEVIYMTFGMDPASRRKIATTTRPAGRRASGYARPNVGPEVDRPTGVCQ